MKKFTPKKMNGVITISCFKNRSHSGRERKPPQESANGDTLDECNAWKVGKIVVLRAAVGSKLLSSLREDSTNGGGSKGGGSHGGNASQ